MRLSLLYLLTFCFVCVCYKEELVINPHECANVNLAVSEKNEHTMYYDVTSANKSKFTAILVPGTYQECNELLPHNLIFDFENVIRCIGELDNLDGEYTFFVVNKNDELDSFDIDLLLPNNNDIVTFIIAMSIMTLLSVAGFLVVVLVFMFVGDVCLGVIHRCINSNNVIDNPNNVIDNTPLNTKIELDEIPV